jgi:hypothetical protein
MQQVPPPYTHHIDQHSFLRNRGFAAYDDYGPRRRFPREQPFIEYDPVNRGWYQGGRRKASSFKPRHYWARPNDGKRTGTWGRLKDALMGEGPDVFVTTSGDRRTLMRDRPMKWGWSGWGLDDAERWNLRADMDHRVMDEMPMREVSWTNASSRMRERYNFRTRRYEAPQPFRQNEGADGVWRDAQWRPGAKTADRNPYSFQTPEGEWWSRVPVQAGQYAGGRPRI